MAYAASRAYEAVTGKEMPDHGLPYPKEPAGTRWDKETADEKLPELVARFGSR